MTHSTRFGRKSSRLWNKGTTDRAPSHYDAHMTEAEYIALKMLAVRMQGPRKPTPVTIRKFSWEKD